MRPLEVPIWCQNRDPLPDGQQDPFHATDCGEECASMVLVYRKGIALPAGVIRALIPGHSDHGETTPGDLQRVLRLFGVAANAMEIDAVDLQRSLITHIRNESPVIALGNWLDPHVLHWVVAVGFGQGKLMFNEPFYGERRLEPWGWVMSRYSGEVVIS